MSANTASKRSRASAEQLNQMVDFMLANEGLAGGIFQKLHGKVESDKKWSELKELLNSLGGAVKSVDQWHTVSKHFYIGSVYILYINCLYIIY